MSTRQRGRLVLSAICFSGALLTGNFIPARAYADTSPGSLYPIALSTRTLAGVAENTVIRDISNGSQPGNFGWLTWAGSPSEPTLVKSLTSPGNSVTYTNPDNPIDHVISVGDWISGKPGVSNSKNIRDALTALTARDIVIPVWDQARGQGANAAYHVTGFATIRIVSFMLPGQNRISARFLGFASCGGQNQAPMVNAGGDQSVFFPEPVYLHGTVTDDNQPLAAAVTQSWSVVSGPGTVDFANSNALITTATFSTPGIFTLRLTANDTVLTNDDDMVVTVNLPNQPPTGDPQSMTTAEDVPLNVTLTGSDPESAPLNFVIATPPNHGTLTGAPPHMIYLPAADYNGSDSFAFRANDGQMDSSNATVSISITPVNDQPVADSITVTNREDTAVQVMMSGADVEGSNLIFRIVANPNFGTLGAVSSNTVTYTPLPNYNGTDTFKYVANDGLLNSATATVTLDILPVNDAPVLAALPDQTVAEGAALSAPASATDADQPANTLAYSLAAAPAGMTIDPASGVIAWTPTEAQGPSVNTVTVTVTDNGEPALSDSKTFTVTVTEANAAPALAALPDMTVAELTALAVTASATDVDQPANTLAYSLAAAPAGMTVDPASGAITWTPTEAQGPSVNTVTVTVTDNGEPALSDSKTFTVTVTEANNAPIAQNQNFTASEDQTVDGVVMASDADGDALTFSLLGQGGKGTVAMNADGTFTYTPAANMNGSDTFSFMASDGQTNSAPGVVTITLTPVNDAPCLSVPGEQTVSQGALLMFDTNRLISVADVDAGTNLLQLSLSSTRGTLTFGSTNGVTWLEGMNHPTNQIVLGTLDNLNAALTGLTYATSGVSGGDVITLTVDDLGNTGAGGNLTDTQTTTVMVAGTDARTLTVDAGPDQTLGWTNQTAHLVASLSGTGLPDANRVTAEWSLVSGPTNKIVFYFGSETLTLPANGQPVPYAALATFFAPGQYVLRLTANDGLTQAVDEVTFTFIPPDGVPVVALSQTVITQEDTEVVFDLLGYTPQDYRRESSFFVGSYGEQEGFSFHVNQCEFVPVNPPQHGTIEFRGKAEYSFFGGDMVFINEYFMSTRNSVICSYQPHADFSGEDSFTFWVLDKDHFSEATVWIRVLPVDDPPNPLDMRTVERTTVQGEPVSLYLGGTDKDKAPLSFTVTTPPSHGTVVFNPQSATNNSVVAVYIPDAEHSGQDTFVIQAQNGQTICFAEAVKITILPLTLTLDAGPDQALTVPGTLSLTGSLQLLAPVPGVQTNIAWSKISGPGNVIFSDPGSLATTASLEETGTYVLLLSANYGGVHKTDVLKVVVTSPVAEPQPFTRSSSGTDFWLTKVGNRNPYFLNDARLGLCDGRGSLMITSEVDTKGLVDFDVTDMTYDWTGGAGWGGPATVTHYSQPFVVRAGLPTLIPIDGSAGFKHNYAFHVIYQMLSDCVTRSAIHVTANEPVSVCEIESGTDSVGGYFALPTPMLGTNYVVMSYQNTMNYSDTNKVIGGTGFAVVAPNNDTHVSILPTANSGLRTAGEPFEITLQSGEVYRLFNEVDPEADYTGTEITSDKPVAVFGGNKETAIPSSSLGYDQISEQMPPVDMWGRHFISMPFATRANGDTFRFLAAYDGTQISVNGVAIATLNRGEFHERIIDGPAEIVSSHPILVAQFSNSSGYDGSYNSDPSMVLVPAVEQYGTLYVFGTSQEWNWKLDSWEHFQNYVNLIVPAEALDSVTLDGETVASDQFNPIAESGYYGVQIPIEAGGHRVKATAPICATVYGGRWGQSYACLAGLYFIPSENGLNVQVQQATPYAVTGSEKAVVARVTDGQGKPMPDTRVQFTVTGVHSVSGWGRTSQNGETAFVYYGDTAGVDLIRASLGEVQGVVTNTWIMPGSNQPPVLSVAPLHYARPGTWYALAGTVSDDALPAGGSLDVTWRFLNGPCLPQVRVAGQASAAGYFEFPGTYVLEVSASDGELSTRSVVTVVVNDPTAVTLQASYYQLNEEWWYNGWEGYPLDSDSDVFAGFYMRLEAAVPDNDIMAAFVEFFDGDTKIGECVPAYSEYVSPGGGPSLGHIDWLIPDAGPLNLTVRITDIDGARRSSDTLHLNVQHLGLTLRQYAPKALVGTEKRVLASLTQKDGSPLERELPFLDYVYLSVAGTHSMGDYNNYNDFGEVAFGYAGTDSGTDVITASFNGLTASVTNLWVTASDNQPPLIQIPANACQVAIPNKPFQPDVTVTDDGLPSSQLAVSWRVVSGPVRPSFSAPHSVSTTIVFPDNTYDTGLFAYVGDYVLELIVSDSEFSSSALISVHVNVPPVLRDVHLFFEDDGRVSFDVEFYDVEDPLVKVELFRGETLLQTVYTEYECWLYEVPLKNGDQVYTVRLTDKQGCVTVSEPIHVTLNSSPPTLEWLTPSSAETVFTERPVTLSVWPTDDDGTVTNVSYYLKQGIIKIPIGQGAGPDFSYAWTPPASGDLVLVAVATDNDGLTSSNVTHCIHVEPAITRISFVSPSDGSSAYCQRPVSITLALSDPLNRYDHAEVFANNVSLGTTTNTTLTWVPAQTGDCLLTAKIYEKGGAFRNADNAVNVLVIPTPQPEVTLTAPVDGSRMPVNEETVVVVNLHDPASLTTDLRVYVNGTLTGQNATRFAWTPTELGSHALQCVVLMSDGNSITSATVNVTVAEMHPPTVSLLSPTNGQWFTAGAVPLVSALASDPDGTITLLTLMLDQMVLAEGTATTLEVPASDVAPGWHVAVAEATDNDGLETASSVSRFFIERNENPVLPVPAQLSAIALSASEIQLSWQPLATNELTQSIIVERWDDAQALWIEITEVQVADSDTLDIGLAPETNYRYRMACVDTNGCRSAYSEEANATTRTVVPTYAVLDLSASLSGVLANRLPGGNILTNAGLTHFDSRRTGPLGTRHAETVLGANAVVLSRAVARFIETWPQIRLDLDPILLSPQSILPSLGYLTGPGGSGVTVSEATAQRFDPADPSTPVKAFVQEHSDLFGFGPEELDTAVVQRDYVSPLTAARTLVWQQQVADIPVFGALFIGHVTATGELAAVSCSFIPTPVQAVNPAVLSTAQAGGAFPVTAPQALVTAVANAGDVFALTDITAQSAAVGVTRGQSFTAGKGIKGEAYVALTWFPVSRNELVLAWQVIFTSPWRGEMFLTVVSALDNQMLYRRNLTATGSPATYRVYTGSSPATAARSLVTLDALDAMASPAGWISDGDNETRGNNVEAHLDRNDDDEPDLPRPTGSPARTFDFALDPAAGPRSYGDAAAVQLFYWNNWMHDVLYGLGFTEAGGNFQNDNFMRGGLEGDALQADAQDGLYLNDGKHRDNANISVPPDGYAPRMQMYVFDGAARDGSLDAEIILHEYTHGLSIRTLGGGAGIDALQTAGMGEGWSDFYALALLADPAADVDAAYPFGAYVAYHGFGTSFEQNSYYGIRRYPYSTDMNKNPLTFADIDPLQATAHVDVPSNPLIGPFNAALADEIHRQGEVWGVMLWEVRASLIRKHGYEQGNSLVLSLVTEGLRLSPLNPNVVQARDAILLADRMLSEGADAPEIWAAFSKRGLGYGAKAPYAYSAIGVRESGELPPALMTEQVEVLGGNGNGIIETNEVNNLLLTLRNQGEGPATQVSVQLSTITPGVQILQAQSVYADIPPTQSCLNAVPFRIATLPEFVDGTPVELSVTMTSAQGVSAGSLSFYTGGSGPALPSGDTGLNEATSLSAEMKDLTPQDLGALEPLWMAEDASCLLRAGKGKYVMWRPNSAPVLMENPNFTAHRVKRYGVVVGELSRPKVTDRFGNVLDRTVGAVWSPGNPGPTPLMSWSANRNDDVVGLAYNRIGDGWSYLGGVGAYPTLHAAWDINTFGQSVGSDSVYMRPCLFPDENGVVTENDVQFAPTEWSEFEADGRMSWVRTDERMTTAGYTISAARGVYYNVLLVSAALFEPNRDQRWLGPLHTIESNFGSSSGQPFHWSSVFSQALLINDRGDVAGTGGGEKFGESWVFRWSPANGVFALDDLDERGSPCGIPVVQQMELLPGGQSGFPYAMNRDGDIAGYSDFDIQNPLQFHAVLWPAGKTVPQALGALSKEPEAEYGYSVAYALNDSRQVVGTSRKYIDGNSGALMNAGALWQWNAAKTGTPGWEISDLDRRVTDPDWRVLSAVGISANGWILGHAQRAVRDSQGHYTGSEFRAVLLLPGDLDIDSDNDAGPYGSPDRSAGEDRIEDRDDQPGKIVMANSDDSDGDGIPDFADGFDLDAANPYNDASLYDQFVPLVLELPLPLDLNVARLEFIYSASDPAEVKCEGAPPVWKPAEGALRIWTVNGQSPRNKRSVAASDPGQYVAPGVSIPASALGFSQAEDIRTKTLYVEGIQRSASAGSERILVRLDPDGPGPLGCVDLDAVRVTVATLDMAVDGNRDGTISFRSDPKGYKDATSSSLPYRFWLNTDEDVSQDGGLSWSDPDPERIPPQTPDRADTQIQSTRDLEDFARLHLKLSKELCDLIKTGEISLGLKWERTGSDNPAIRLYKAVEADGGLGYIKSTTIAAQQFQETYRNALVNRMRRQLVIKTSYTADFVFKASDICSTNVYLIFEGVNAGKASCLVPILMDKRGKKIVGGTEVWVNLVNVEELYMRAHSTPAHAAFPVPYRQGDPPSFPYMITPTGGLVIPLANESFAAGFDVPTTPAFIPATPTFVPAPDEENKCIVFVHGIALAVDEVACYTASFYKRLWWEGYRGRLAVYRWSTPVTGVSDGDGYLLFSDGEYNSYHSAPGLKAYVENIKHEMPGATISLAAHSLGNACAGNALRQGLKVDSYVMLEAAISLGCYFPPPADQNNDALANSYVDELVDADVSTPTPDFVTDQGYRGFLANIKQNIANKWVNYYNEDDFWLQTGTLRVGRRVDWVSWQMRFKPFNPWGPTKNYEYDPALAPGHRCVVDLFGYDRHRPVEDIYEALAFVARSRTRAVGAEPASGNPNPPSATASRNLQLYGFGRPRFDHSGQFQRNICLMYSDGSGKTYKIPFYRQLLTDLNME